VGRASDKVSYRFHQHVAAALEKEPGALYDWIRDLWRRGFDVGVHTLQESIIPKDMDMFERYWMDQFADLLNVTGHTAGKADSRVAQTIKQVLKSEVSRARSCSPE
jgi:hypothetical protein